MSVAPNYYLRGIRVLTKVHKGETLKVKEISLEKLNVNAIIFEQTSVENQLTGQLKRRERPAIGSIFDFFILDGLKVATDFQPPIFFKRT
jgi:hypothetical protein